MVLHLSRYIVVPTISKMRIGRRLHARSRALYAGLCSQQDRVIPPQGSGLHPIVLLPAYLFNAVLPGQAKVLHRHKHWRYCCTGCSKL